LHQPLRGLEIAREQLAHLLGVTRLRQVGEADQIDEQDRDDAPFRDRLGARRRGQRLAAAGAAASAAASAGQATTTLAAKPHRRWVLAAARRAAGDEWGAALAAELATWLVVAAAGRADHHAHPSSTRSRSRPREMRLATVPIGTEVACAIMR